MSACIQFWAVVTPGGPVPVEVREPAQQERRLDAIPLPHPVDVRVDGRRVAAWIEARP